MEIIVKPEQEISSYISCQIKNFLLPLNNYSVEYSKTYTLAEIKEIRNKYPKINIFVSMNKNFMNEELDTIKQILLELDKLNLSGIFFYDLALLKLKKDLNLSIELVWSQTHMVTNYRTCNYYYDMKVKYAYLSKEITKEEIIEISKNSKIKLIVELISKPSIAFSKRKLVSHYYENLKLPKQQLLSIFERISNTNLLAVENNDGVFFLKNKILNGCFILDDLLKTNIDYILLKEDFIQHDMFLQITKQINFYLNNYTKMSKKDKNNWLEKQKELLGEDTGFFYQKTIYRVKK